MKLNKQKDIKKNNNKITIIINKSVELCLISFYLIDNIFWMYLVYQL